VEGVRQDQLGDERTGQQWLTARGGVGTARELARVRRVRAVLQGIVRGTESPIALRPFIGSISYRPTATDEGLDWALDVPDDHRLAAKALLAWDHLRTTAPGRLRPCANDECELYLIDRSKANTGRWCSMAVCGNRMKVRRHYQRRRLASS
jgi:predicted RNA-binding Zn ribbon-like protein